MNAIVIEQARFHRADNGSPRLLASSPGFANDQVTKAEALLMAFGPRLPGMSCPSAIFGHPLGDHEVAVVQVADRDNARDLWYHVLVCARADYEHFLGDPFALARRFPAAWAENGGLPVQSLPRERLVHRTVAQVQAILKRVKAGALKDNEDPEHPDFVRTADNSESPALLGGAQVLVDGGKLVFERPAPDQPLIEGLWTLLPHSTRARLWPATFALGNSLSFDALVVPRLHVADYEGYTSEDQAAEYPPGHFETSLQIAAETGNQSDLDRLLQRRSSQQTLKLGWILLIFAILLVLVPRLLDSFRGPPPVPYFKSKVATAAAMVAVGNPWTALALRLSGPSLWQQPNENIP